MPQSVLSSVLGLLLAFINLQTQPLSGAQQRETHSVAKIDQSSGHYALIYGPFRVVGDRLELVGKTDVMSSSWLAQVLADHPNLDQLDMIECPGTIDDIANLQLGRMIRKAGLRTRVPNRGSVRSGAVELFLAGTERIIESGAEFAVHSWLDEYGRQADKPSRPEFRKNLYLEYYTDMGMSPEKARAFYDMTISAPYERPRWLDAAEMGQWISKNP